MRGQVVLLRTGTGHRLSFSCVTALRTPLPGPPPRGPIKGQTPALSPAPLSSPLTEKINIRVLDPFTIKPLDRKLILDSARATKGRILTVEDHYYEGNGLGQRTRGTWLGRAGGHRATVGGLAFLLSPSPRRAAAAREPKAVPRSTRAS